jgi:ribosomal protein S18 acetylase RimI-like enzyme
MTGSRNDLGAQAERRSSGSLIIRKADQADAAALAELAERTFRDAFGALNTATNMDLHCRSSYGRKLQAREIADPCLLTLVCEDNGTLIAYAQLRRGKAPDCVAAEQTVEIQRLYVDKEWHGKGIAQDLMNALLDHAREDHAGVVWLGVWEHNPRAIAFYAKFGFRECGDQTFLLGRDDQRDLIMQKALRD